MLAECLYLNVWVGYLGFSLGVEQANEATCQTPAHFIWNIHSISH